MDGGDESFPGGILAVAEIVTEHGHAVRRDLLAVGIHEHDIGGPLCGLGEFLSFVLASPPNSAVRYCAEKGWPQTDILLAQHNERTLGVKYDRPGIEAPEETPNPVGADGSVRMTPQSIDEFKARRARDMQRGAELAASESKTVSGKAKRVV